MPKTKLVWDALGEHFYETGVDHGVISVVEDGVYTAPKVWNGLTAVTEQPSGAEASAQYADNIKYLTLISAEDFGLSIEAFYYPPEFGECDGTIEVAPGVTIGQQARKSFGFSYRTRIGNDTKYDTYGYKLHIAYGCLASPSEKGYTTVNDSPEALTFSWDVSTTPISVDDEKYRPTALITIDSTTCDPDKLAALEAMLYGDDDEDIDPRFPMPADVIRIMTA